MLHCEDGITIDADPRLMKSLIQNLVGNAWKYSGSRNPSVIEFGREQHGDTCAYFILDNGAGFNMEHAGKLFQAFSRLHSYDQFPGTGIGLATVARIVNRYAGRIWAVSDEGQGATFYFTLVPGRPGVAA